MRIFNEQLLSAGDMSADITSDPIFLDHIYVCAVQAVYAGSPVGSLKLQGTCDGTNWTDLTGSSINISASGSTIWNVDTIGYLQMRVVYTSTSGSGDLSIRVNGKGN